MTDFFKNIPRDLILDIASLLLISDLAHWVCVNREMKRLLDNMLQQLKIEKLLLHVSRGEQDEAEKILKVNAQLLERKGTVTDYSKRTFVNITPFQYALWAKDSYMWMMILSYLSFESARKQFQALEKKGTHYGTFYDFNPFIFALKTYAENYQHWSDENCEKHWCQKVGDAQRNVPAHVAQEYCDPEESFRPIPTFKKPNLKRSLAVYDWRNQKKTSWYHLLWSENIGIARDDMKKMSAAASGKGYKQGLAGDFPALCQLAEVRTNELIKLKEYLFHSKNSTLPARSW